MNLAVFSFLLAAATTAPPAAPPPTACHPRATDLPGIDTGDPRLQSEHLIVVQKHRRQVQLFSDGAAVPGAGEEGRACYRVGLGFTPNGHKQRQGDGRTPEGWYTTSDKPWSSFYGAIAIHYPNAADARAAREDGRIPPALQHRIAQAIETGTKPPQNSVLGGEILFHGGGSSSDWTLGCIALDNDALDDLRSHLPRSMKATVLILP